MNNLIKKYEQVTDHSGLNWYREGNAWCQRVADKYNLSLVAVCGVLSALSPATNYEQNKRDVLGLIQRKPSYKCGTYGNNVAKAREILKHGIPLFNEKTGAKTYNFFHNLLEPDNSAFICVDRHAYVIATGEPYIGIHLAKYRKIAEHYRNAAKKLSLLPNELQAVLWVDYRIKENIKFNIDVPF
jgi:hypothetical protein